LISSRWAPRGVQRIDWRLSTIWLITDSTKPVEIRSPARKHRTLNEKLALKILANEGIEAIWRLHVAAALSRCLSGLRCAAVFA
jgi:hypothetical protein